MQLEVSQEEAAVLSALKQVKEMTGFGKVVVEIKSSQIVLVEISISMKIKRNVIIEEADEA